MRYQQRALAINRATSTTIVRDCYVPIHYDGSNAKHCLEQVLHTARELSEQISSNFAIHVSTYYLVDASVERRVFLSVTSEDSPLSSEPSRYDEARVGTTLRPLLEQSGVVTIVEVYSAGTSGRFPFERLFSRFTTVQYEDAIL